MEVEKYTPKELHNVEKFSAKELRMERAGATRESAYKAVVDGLTAQSMTLDKFGEEHYSSDTSSRLRSAEIILKLRGDLKPDNLVENKTVNVNISTADLSPLLELVNDVREQLSRVKIEGHQTGEIIDVEYRATA